MWPPMTSVLTAVVQCGSSVGGSPCMPTRMIPPRFCAATSVTPSGDKGPTARTAIVKEELKQQPLPA